MPGIYASKLAGALQGAPPLAVLLWGEDAGAIRQAAEHVRARVAAQAGLALDDPFAVEVLDLADVLAEPSRLTDSALTLSFTAPHKLISLRGVSAETRADDLKALAAAVQETLGRAPAGVTLVLPCPGLDKKSPLVKVVEGHAQGLGVRFFTDGVRDLESFLKTELMRLDAVATPAALALLAQNLGADREVARRELEKLVTYAGAERPLTETHVQASLCGATPAGVFLLAEAVLARQPAKVDRLLGQLAEQGEDFNGAFMLVLGELNKLAQAQQLLAAGEGEESVLRACGKAMLPPPAKGGFLQAAARYPAKRLAQVPERALEALTLARSGLLEANHVLGRALLAWSV